MGNCQQSANQQRLFDDKNTVDSQDYNQKSSDNNNNKKEETEQHQSPNNNNNNNNHPLQKASKKKDVVNQPDCQYTFIRRPAPNFTGVAYHNGFKKVSLRDFKGQYVVLFFFPYDFSEMCRKEILAFSDLNDKFQKAACQVVGCSQDSQFAHMNYCQKKRTDGGLGQLDIPLLSDVDRQISQSYGVIIEDGDSGEKGASFRSTFIIDNYQILRHMSINDIGISVNPEEVLRLVYTFQQNDRENPHKHSNQRNQQQQQQGKVKGCPFAAQAKELLNNQDIDTFSRYQRKKSGKAQKKDAFSETLFNQTEDESNKNVNTKQSHSGQEGQKPFPSSKIDETQESIIVRLGGDDVVQDIADKFVSYMFSDPLLKPFFLNISNQSKQKKIIGSFLKTYFGSPSQQHFLTYLDYTVCIYVSSRYVGKNLKEAHKNLGLNDDHFNKASSYIQTILKDMNVKPSLCQDIMMCIEPLRSQITQKSSLSLFERVNGEKGIKSAVALYFSKILKINEIKPFYSKVDQDVIQEAYVSYLSLVLGGQPNKYKGKQMRDAHTSLHIPEKVFNFCALQIQYAFKDTGVDTNTINEIGRLLECLRSEIPKKLNTLFDRLGGAILIEKVCKRMYEDKIEKEPKIKDFFKNVDLKLLAFKMNEFYSMITGGPST